MQEKESMKVVRCELKIPSLGICRKSKLYKVDSINELIMAI